MARILVVEDDEAVIGLLAEVLRSWGHEVILATDGREAYRQIYIAWPVFDVVLCDLELPRMQGHDLLTRLEDQLRPRTPVVVVSGKDRLIDSLDELDRWIVGVLKKPFHIEDLRGIVDEALRRRADLLQGQEEEHLQDLERRLDVLVAENVQLFEEARLDPLSRLPNRRRLEEDLGKKHANTNRYGSAFALALVDVDDFRRFNDKLGYEGGDVAIRHIAKLLDQATREGDTVYRYGGDEFVVLMEAQSLVQGIQVADRLRLAVVTAAVPEAIGGLAEQITLSVGVAAAIKGDSRSIVALIREANRHLDDAKLSGGNCIRPEAWSEAGPDATASTGAPPSV